MSSRSFPPLAGLALALAGLALLAAPAPAAPGAPLEIATGCRAAKVRLAGGLLLWQDGSGRGADLEQGCRGETRAAWVADGEALPLERDFLGAGWRAAASGARAARLESGKVLLVWAESSKIAAALLAPGAEAPERRFEVSSEDTPSEVAAPRPLAKAGGGFLVIFESDFFSGRRRNPVWRAFAGEDPAAEPAAEMQPAFADFVSVREPIAARLGSGAFGVGGPGIGPLGDGYFLQFWGPGGDTLGEPLDADEKKRQVLGGDLAAAKEIYVFTWNIRRPGKNGEQQALLRLYSAAGQPLGKPRELGPAAGTPAIAAIGGKIAAAWVDPTAERRIRLLTFDPTEGAEAGEPQDGPAVGAGVAEVAIDAATGLLAWAEAARIVVAPLP